MTKPLETPNKFLTAQARESLRGKWRLAIGTYFVASLMLVGVSFIPFAGGLVSLVISGPMALGLAIFSLSLARDQESRFSQVFEGFNNFTTALIAYLVMFIFVFLWTLLLIIPGIIASLAYSQTFYIIVENSSITPRDAIRKSKEMMYGYKWKLFRLHFRFLGWALLCILTVGIGFLWLFPYVGVSMAKFYEDIAHRPSIDKATAS